MTCVQISAPLPLLSIEEAKRQVRRDDRDDDSYLLDLIQVAQGQIEAGSPLGRSIMPQVWELRLDDWKSNVSSTYGLGAAGMGISLPYPPIVSLDSVSYADAAGDRQPLTGCRIGGDPFNAPMLLPPASGWPALSASSGDIRIRYTAGYVARGPDGEPLLDERSKPSPAPPAMLKHAALLLLAHLYEYRAASVPVGASTTLPMGFDALVTPYRVWGR